MFIRKFIYKFEYKRLSEELRDLIGFFDNMSESDAACSYEDYEEERLTGVKQRDDEKIEKLTKRLNKVYYRVEELERRLIQGINTREG